MAEEPKAEEPQPQAEDHDAQRRDARVRPRLGDVLLTGSLLYVVRDTSSAVVKYDRFDRLMPTMPWSQALHPQHWLVVMRSGEVLHGKVKDLIELYQQGLIAAAPRREGPWPDTFIGLTESQYAEAIRYVEAQVLAWSERFSWPEDVRLKAIELHQHLLDELRQMQRLSEIRPA